MNKKSRIITKVLSFALAVILIFITIPNNKVYAADVGIGTDGNAVDLSLWNYTANGDIYCLNEYIGSVVDGKIVGSVPASINGMPVTAMEFTFSACTGLLQAPEIPYSVACMKFTFEGCKGLTQAPKIPDNVTDMPYTFANCIGLIQAPEIPNKVTNMIHTFSGCTGLKQVPEMPDGVINMNGTFSGCKGLAQAPEIPNSVIDMSYTFTKCTGLTQAPEIPNKVTKMIHTFSGCTGLTQAPEIPNSVINMYYAFSGCTELTQAPKIPNNVTNIPGTFLGCTNLTSNVFLPQKVTNLSGVFKNTSKPITMIYSSNSTVADSYEVPANVTKVIDSVSPEISSVTGGDTSDVTINATDNYQIDSYAVTTSNTVPTTGWQLSNVFSNLNYGTYYAWAIDCVGNVSKSSVFSVIKALGTDGSNIDLSLWTYTANGDTYSLDGYKGSIVDGRIIGSVPATINGKPVTEMPNTFKDCTALTQAPEIPSSVTAMSYTFSGCTGLTQVPQIPDGVTNMRYTFNGCTRITQPPVLPSSVTTINHTFAGCTALTQIPEIPYGVTDINAAFSRCTKITQTPQIPDSVVDMSYAFYLCTGLTQLSVIPNGIKNMSYTYYGCTNITGEIFIPNSVAKMLNIFTNTSMPITMIYSSKNTVAATHTAPSNVAKTVDLASPEIAGINEIDGTITVNATDNYSVEKYAITTSSTAPTTGWQISNVFSNMSNGRYYAWAMDRVGNVSVYKDFMFPQVDAVGTDGNEVDLLLWDITDNGDAYSVNKYAGSIVDGKIIGSVPANINGKPVTAMPNTFKDCAALTQAPEIPSSVTSMSYTFSGCTGLTQAPQISDGVTNMSYTFNNCTALTQAPKIPNSVTNMEYAFSGCTGLTQAPQIPDGVTNMRYTFNGCTALTQAPVLPSSVTTINHTFAGCTALTQPPEIPDGVTDMNAAFARCTKLTQTPQIPDSAIDMSYTFYMCTGLNNVPVIPNGIKNMDYTFYGCTNITGEIFIPNSVIRMSNIFTNTSMPITMKYSSDNTVASSYVAPSNVTKVLDSIVFFEEAAPEATVQAITGILQVGDTLTGNYTYSDVNGDLEGISTYKWYREDDSAGLNKIEISGATGNTYLLQSADAGKYISFEVTPVAVTGIAQGTAVESEKIGVVELKQ